MSTIYQPKTHDLCTPECVPCVAEGVLGLPDILSLVEPQEKAKRRVKESHINL